MSAMRRPSALAGVLGLLCALCATQKAPVAAQTIGGWFLLWNDEFSGTTLNRNKWEAQIGNGCQHGIDGWGNAEKQWYSDMPANLRLEGGKLVLQAAYDEGALAAQPPRKPFTSARVRTFQRMAVVPNAQFPTVRIEARIKVPRGLGTWPAFWLLADDGAYAACSGCGRYGEWASSGEIDIMETANNASRVQGTLHYGGRKPANTYTTADTSLTSPASFADNWHTYRLDWTRKQMRWYVDNTLFATQYSGNGTRAGWFTLGPSPQGDPATAAPLPGDAPFDRKFHVILNLALGSEGSPFTTAHNNGAPVTEENLKNTLLSQAGQGGTKMEVDWVRVWGRRT